METLFEHIMRRPMAGRKTHLSGCGCRKCQQNQAFSTIQNELLFEATFNSFGDPGGDVIQVRNRKEAAKSDLVPVSSNRQLEKKTAAAWKKLVTAARKDGIPHPRLTVKSGFRSVKRQERLWANALKKYGSAQKARKWVARPGKSSHQTGRAIDFNMGVSNSSRLVAQQKRTKAFKWLQANANRFGFYNYRAEPWHWEYNPTSAQESSSGISTIIGGVTDFFENIWSKGNAAAIVYQMTQKGIRDPDKITDEIFYYHHPELKRRPIRSSEKDLAAEWLSIRKNIVTPLLQKL